MFGVMFAAHLAAASHVALTLIGYPAYLAAKARLRPRPVQASPYAGSVSVILTSRNEGPRIAMKMREILAQRGSHQLTQLIVASDGSTDDTLLQARSVHDARVLVLDLPARGKSSAIASAIPHAQGDIVIFSDTRQRIGEDTFTALLAPLSDASVCVSSCALALPTSQSAGLYWRYERALRIHESRTGSVVGATGALYAVRRSHLHAPTAGCLLDDVSIPMDAALQGGRVVIAEDAIVHDVEADKAHEQTRKVRTISGTFQLLAMRPEYLHPRKNPLFARFVMHKLARLALPVSLTTLLGTSALLALTLNPYGVASLGAQLAFWFIALLASRGVSLGALGRISQAFASLQWATLQGASRFLRGDLTWAPK
jgi:cellulose synthase/poly-beta-1,6-N-acetylglucosamine synthase-like glycosyltransferase